MDKQKNKDSDSGFSSSGSSSASMVSIIDEQTLRQGTEPIKSLILQGYCVFLLQGLVPAITKCIEFSFSIRYLGLQACKYLTLLAPICEFMSQSVVRSLAQATNLYISKNLAKNQVLIANTYLAHFYVLIFVYVVVCFIVFFTALQNLFPDPIVGLYFLARTTICTFTASFTIALFPFLQAENRYFLMVMESIVDFLLFIVGISFAFVNRAYMPLNLTCPAIAYLLSSCVCTIWFIIVLFKVNVLEITYKGVVRFSFKRLSPIRPKFLVHILTMCLPQLLENSLQQVLQLTAVLIVNFSFKEEHVVMTQYVRLGVFSLIRGVLSAPITAFSDIFLQLSSYNMGIKKITRVYEVIRGILIAEIFLLPVIAVIASVADKILYVLIPVVIGKDAVSEDNLFILNNSESAAQQGAWSCFLVIFFSNAVKTYYLENQSWFTVLILAPGLLFGILFLVFSQNLFGENSSLTLIIATVDVLNCAIGVNVLALQFVKYYQLNKLNTAHALKAETGALKTNQDQEQDAIRQSVAYDLARPAESEEQQKQKIKAAGINAMFNKSVALRSSMAFQNFKDSIHMRGSEFDQNRDSNARNSNIAYGSQMLNRATIEQPDIRISQNVKQVERRESGVLMGENGSKGSKGSKDQ